MNMSATIEIVSIGQVDASPFRNLDHFPYVERKIAALQRSMNDVGMWPGIIGRRVGNRIQIAFGHQRLEAARRNELKEIPIIVEDLDDRAMLAYMGRENGEDYNADFLVMLETWEAAVRFLYDDPIGSHTYQPLVIAKLLGWTKDRSGHDTQQMSTTALACNSAHLLLDEKRIERSDLRDMTVTDARDILTRARADMERIEQAGKSLGTSASNIESAKEHIARAIKTTADQSRAGVVAKKDLSRQVDVNAYKHARSSRKGREAPLFMVFGKILADGIAKMLKSDTTAEKLNEIVRQLSAITTEEDKVIVRRLSFELGELVSRASAYRRKLETAPAAKSVPMRAIGG